jgi:hypothetical protein
MMLDMTCHFYRWIFIIDLTFFTYIDLMIMIESDNQDILARFVHIFDTILYNRHDKYDVFYSQ